MVWHDTAQCHNCKSIGKAKDFILPYLYIDYKVWPKHHEGSGVFCKSCQPKEKINDSQ